MSKRSDVTTNTVGALETGLEVLWRAYEGAEDVGQEGAEDLLHALYGELGEVEAAEKVEVPAREWRCEQDRWMSLFGAIGATVVEDASPEERAFLARQKGATIQAPDETVVDAIDWSEGEETPEARRARNWARRAR